jgi:hypothetical protein
VNFRHEGSSEEKPQVILLRDLSLEKYSLKVLLFYSASGSGKTVELVGSSASCKVLFTLVLMLEDSDLLNQLLPGDLERNGGVNLSPRQLELEIRNGSAYRTLMDAISGMVSDNLEDFEEFFKQPA